MIGVLVVVLVAVAGEIASVCVEVRVKVMILGGPRRRGRM